MSSRPFLRQPVGCSHCHKPLLALCRQTDPTEPLTGMFSFACPSCGAWNNRIELAGAGVQKVMVDPRRSCRY
jgi:hypothetical protein